MSAARDPVRDPEPGGGDGGVLVAAQVLAVAALAWPGPPRWRLPRGVRPLAVVAGAVGTALTEEGLRFLGRDVTAFPEPRAGARLQTTGPYAHSRHPVYAGLLVAATATAVLRRRPEPLVALAALAGVLHVKTGREERLLARRFGLAWEEYAASTPRLPALPRPGRGAAPGPTGGRRTG